MRTRVTKIVSLISLLSILCLMAVSCSSGNKSSYVLMCGEDNGLVAAYRAYYELDGTTVKEIREDRFNNLVTKTDDYKLINQTTYNFTADAKSSNASKWTITESGFDEELYDIGKLVKYLKKMDVYYTGDIYIKVSVFDSYTVIEVQRLDGNTITDITTGLFKGSSMIKLQKGEMLKSLWKVYKRT